MKERQVIEAKVRSRSLHQIYMLTAMFLLGMAVNLMGLPSELDGSEKTISSVFTALHGIIGIGLIIGSILSVVFATKIGKKISTLAWSGLIFVVLTFVAGILTIAIESDWWSYVMAVGFLATVLIYGAIIVRVK